MNNHTNSKVSDDEALAVFALTQLDRGTSVGGGIGNTRDQKPVSKTAAVAAYPATTTTTATATANTTPTTAATTSRTKPPAAVAPRRTGKSKQGVPKTVSIQTIPKKGNYVNHSYADYSAVPNDQNFRIPESLEDMTFAEKLHAVLSTAEYQHCISWLPHGRAFRVSIPVFFEKTVCPKFFGHKRFSSFLRQLNNHGFKHLTSGPSRNGYYHECFLRGDGLEHIVQYMPRAKDARRQVPDPDNEPDFDKISKRFPLPEVTTRAAALQDGTAHAVPVSDDEAKIRAILQKSAKHEQEQAKPKARTFDTMAAGGTTPTTTLDQLTPAAKKPASLLPFAPIPPVLLPPPPPAASAFEGLPTNLWALSLHNQQVMEQLQLQQQLQQMLSRIQQGDATQQLLRCLYNNR